MACADDKESSSNAGNGNAEVMNVGTASPEKPRRNLTKDFALCLDKSAVAAPEGIDSKTEAPTPLTGKMDSSHPSIFSPTSVIPATQHSPAIDAKNPTPYRFHLHPSLQRGLSQALVDRVSFYGIIHDINKEASAMAVNDPKQPEFEETKEESSCALVQAAIGNSFSDEDGGPLPNALIDEEAWLLDAVGARGPEERTSTACPPTFLQAMGEREYENPVQALSGASRTQLWKPSRSWWEAKSGKNPWIEPTSHNKRWRYLWPLIHYHKFLAKCIKKLKRNGVDVKHAVSPVAVFLRNEVCWVSDHLAECSRFDSDEWMACLKHFDGWTEIGGEEDLRERVRRLKLRPLDEPGDVESKLLRDQVDRHFLTAMAKARAQLREGNESVVGGDSRSRGQPPMYPRSTLRADATPVPNHIQPGYQQGGRRPPSYPSPGGRPEQYSAHHHPPHHTPYWGWEQQPSMVSPYGDSSSVHSALSSESGYPQPYPMYMHPPPPGYHHGPYYSGPMVYPPHMGAQRMYKPADDGSDHQSYIDPAVYGGPMYHPYPTPVQVAHHVPVEASEISEQEDISEGVDIEIPQSENSVDEKEATPPVKFNMQAQHQSPFWSHLDSVAAGLATPAKSPGTPRRDVHEIQDGDELAGYATAAQPLLLRGYHPYGHYGARDGYAPPSPATQFLMSPQPNFAPAYGYTYHRSPRKKSPQQTPNAGEMTPPPVRKVVAAHDVSRESPTTVGTATESESLPEGSA